MGKQQRYISETKPLRAWMSAFIGDIAVLALINGPRVSICACGSLPQVALILARAGVDAHTTTKALDTQQQQDHIAAAAK